MARRDGSADRTEGEDVLSPEELDIATDEHVAALGSGRYVVGSDGPPNEDKVEQVRAELGAAITDDSTPEAEAADDERAADQESTSEQVSTPERPTIDGHQVKTWIDAQLEDSDTQYAYRIAAKSGDQVSHQQLASDDVGMAFDALLMWYAQQVGHGTPVEEVLGILLAESNIRVRYPTERLLAYVESHDLEPDDSIADLLRAVQSADGLVFPPRHRNQD
jgi:hypothetical protein